MCGGAPASSPTREPAASRGRSGSPGFRRSAWPPARCLPRTPRAGRLSPRARRALPRSFGRWSRLSRLGPFTALAVELVDVAEHQLTVGLPIQLAVHQLGSSGQRELDRLAAQLVDRGVLLASDVLSRAVHDRLTLGARLVLDVTPQP